MSEKESTASHKSKAVTLGSILEKITPGITREEAKPAVRANVVEWFAKKMTEAGYDFTEDTLAILLDYLKGYNLWLFGNVGVGKTFFFDCMNQVRNIRGTDRIIKLSMIETQGWNMDDAREWANDSRDNDVLIDDVGAEPIMNHFGQKVEVFPYLLEKRMQLTLRRTHITSNLGGADILKRYDRRISDRFTQMFKPYQIKAKRSRRKLSPWLKSFDGGGVA